MIGAKYPPGPKSALAAYYRLLRDPLGFVTRIARQYGDIAHLQVGSRHDFLINHPDYIKTVLLAGEEEMLRSFPRPLVRLLGAGLLTIQGEAHRRERRLLQPMFHQEAVARYAGMMTAHCERLSERWCGGQRLELSSEMLRLAMLIVAQSLFGLDAESKVEEIGQLFSDVLEMTHKNRVPYLDEFSAKLPLPRVRRYRQARGRLDALMRRMIAERQNSETNHQDLLSEMLQLRDPETGARSLTDEQVRDEAVTTFAAGHETIGTALAWTWYLLAQHPEVESRFHRELDAVLAGRTPGAEDACRLTYCGMVFSESMRLYPPVWLMVRRPARDFALGDYVLPAGSYVHVSQYLAHRDPRFFPEPERFDPERWSPEAVASRPKFCFFPFGGGSRRCIGEAFAWMEGILALATLAQRWTFRLVPGHPIGLEPYVTLRPKHGLAMTVHERVGCRSASKPVGAAASFPGVSHHGRPA